MKDLHCRDAGMDCDFIASGNTDKEVMDRASAHAESVHKMKVTPDLTKRMKILIHEKVSEAHRKSMAAARK